MTPSRLVLFAAAIILMGGALFQGARVLSRQRLQLRALRQHIEQLENRLAAQNREREATTRELALAERQLAELTGPADSELSDAERARNEEIAAWLSRVKRLKQLFEERPDQRIPEMRLLTDDDWLRVGRQTAFDSEERIRKALASVRGAARRHFASSLAKALPKFAKASNGEPPTSVFALAPYLENPADAEFLFHLEVIEVVRSGAVDRDGVVSVLWSVQEKAAVDADYDSRTFVHSNGGLGTISAPQAWIPDFRERSQRAYRDFAAANHGASPAGIEELISFFNPPLDQAAVEKLLKAEREGWR